MPMPIIWGPVLFFIAIEISFYMSNVFYTFEHRNHKINSS